jgi:molybdopterin-binding protein
MASSLLTPRQAADRLGISYPTIKQWLYRGKLTAVKTPGGHYRIPEQSLAVYLNPPTKGKSGSKKLTRPMISGRNQLVGQIVEVHVDGLLARVRLAIGNQQITAIITADSAREMNLKVGQTASALIKSTEVMIMKVAE